MFGLRLSLHKWKQHSYLYLINKLQLRLNKSKTVEEIVFKDILDTFAYNDNGYYRLYMRKAPIGSYDLQMIIQDLRGDYTPVNEVDLHYTYHYVLEYLHDKLLWYPNVAIAPNTNGEKYFDVYWK